MQTIVIARPGGPDVLELRDVPEPMPGPGQVRVRVEAAGVNRADVLQRLGRYPPPEGWPEDVPGLEYAGVVDGVGPGVERWSDGQRVMGLVGGGAYAEYVVVDERQPIPVPERLGATEAAAVPEVFLTAYDALFARLRARPGQTLLIHAVGSGVGTAALQLAKRSALTVIGTSRSAWKLERAAELGLDEGVDASGGGWADEVLRRTAGRGVDLVLDLVGAAYLAGNLRCLTTLGRHVVVGLPSGRAAELDLGTLLGKRLTLVGTALRSRSDDEKAVLVTEFARDVLPLLADGRARPIVHEVLPLERAADAHRLLEADATFGKVVLRVTGDG